MFPMTKHRLRHQGNEMEDCINITREGSHNTTLVILLHVVV